MKHAIIKPIILGFLAGVLLTFVIGSLLPTKEEPPQEILKHQGQTYVPKDIEVSSNTEGRAAVSFTHLDGMHYVLYFNEGESNET